MPLFFIYIAFYLYFSFRPYQKNLFSLSCIWVWQPHPLFQLLSLIWIFFKTRLCPSLSTFHHYYYLLLKIIFFQVYRLEKANELHNHFVEGHPSSNKFTIDLASHVFHNLLGTMFTVSSMYKCKNCRNKCIVNNEQG